MFVSSYSTYIDTNVTKRTTHDKNEAKKETSDSFASRLLEENSEELINGSKLPLNYISNYKALHNRQQLQEQSNSQEKGSLKNRSQVKFTKINSMSSAKVAYGDNSKLFSLIPKPKLVIDQTPKINRTLSSQTQAKQESIMKTAMVNTYVSNENYFRITSAA